MTSQPPPPSQARPITPDRHRHDPRPQTTPRMATTDRRQSQREEEYTLPTTHARLSEISSPAPEQNPYEWGRYGHATLEEARGVEGGERVPGGGRAARAPDGSEGGRGEEQEEEEEEVGCLSKVVKAWVKRAIRRKRGE